MLLVANARNIAGRLPAALIAFHQHFRRLASFTQTKKSVRTPKNTPQIHWKMKKGSDTLTQTNTKDDPAESQLCRRGKAVNPAVHPAARKCGQKPSSLSAARTTLEKLQEIKTLQKLSAQPCSELRPRLQAGRAASCKGQPPSTPRCREADCLEKEKGKLSERKRSGHSSQLSRR